MLASLQATEPALASGPSWAAIALAVAGSVALFSLGAALSLALFPWRIEASLKGQTRDGAISLGAGAALAGLSASAAGVLGGPGVVVVHFRARELYKRTAARVSFDALLAWLDAALDAPKKERGLAARLAGRVKSWLLPRTDLGELPGLGARVVLGLRDLSLQGALTLGFEDAARAGNTAAVLYPIAGLVAPFGRLDVSFDWSGQNRLDGDLELSCRVVPARVLRELIRFAWQHIHWRATSPPKSSTVSLSSTT